MPPINLKNQIYSETETSPRPLDRGKSQSRINLLKALDPDFSPDSILQHDYTKAQNLALEKTVEDRLFKRVGAPTTGQNQNSPRNHLKEDSTPFQGGQMGYFRRFIVAMEKLNTNEDFELLVIILILANCVTLAMYDPLQSDESKWNGTLNTLDLALNIMFTVEMLVRIIGGTGVAGYLKEPWNLFDGIMVLAGYTAFLPVGNESSGTSSIRALRALRALRPLRTITRFESLRSVVVCFLEALPLLVSVVGLLFFFLFLFAIAGIQMFVQVYHHACVHDITGDIEVALGNSPDELGCGGSRSCPADYTCQRFDKGTNIDVAGFDNIGTSMLTIFQCTTLGGWSYVMYRVMDNTSTFSVIFFLFLILFGAYFVAEGLGRRLRRGRKRIKLYYRMGHYHIRRLVLTQRFAHFFLICIIINTILLALEFDGMPTKMELVLQDMNTCLTGLFTIEMCLKLMGLGFWEYISDGFNIFDSVIVLMALLELGFQGGGTTALKSIKSLRVLKSFRVFRLFKMFRYLASLRKIGEVLLSSFSSFMAIVLLMFIFMVVFAIVGLHVYGGIIPEDDFPNFNSFLNSIIVMFNVLTLEDWEIIMYSVMRKTNFGSVFYFVAWVVLGKYTFLTLFLAVTLEAFESKYDVEASSEAYLAYKKVQMDLKQQKSEGENTPEPILEDDLDTDNKLMETIKATVRRASAIQAVEVPQVEKPKWSESESDTSETDKNSAEVEFGPDVCRMLNIDPTRSSSFRMRAASAAPSKSRRAGDKGGKALSFSLPSSSLPLGEGIENGSKNPEESFIEDLAENLLRNTGPESSPHRNDLESSEMYAAIASGDRHICSDAAEFDECDIPDIAVPRITPGALKKRKETLQDFGYLSSSESGTSWAPSHDEILAQGCTPSPDSHPMFAKGTCHEQAGNDSRSMEKGRDFFSSKNKGKPTRRLLSASPSCEAEMSYLRGSVDLSHADLKGLEIDKLVKERQEAMLIHELISHGPSPVFDEFHEGEELAQEGGKEKSADCELPPLTGTSLFVMKEDNPLRLWLYKVINTDIFDYTMFFCIICSSFDQVDLLIVASSILVIVLESTHVQFVKGFRVLRAIKPLRALTRSAGMLLVFRSVTLSLAAMANVSIVCLLFFAIFAILGVQLFSGRFYRCNNIFAESKEQCVGEFIDADTGEVKVAEWTNAAFNFDHLGNALLSLFVTVTQDGYNDLMFDAMAVTDKGLQPKPQGNPGGFFFFMAFIMLCAFCLLNLYVGVVFYQFSRIRLLSQTGSAFLTDHQQEWSELTKMVFRLKPISKAPVPKPTVQRQFYHIVSHKVFDYLITIVIMLNVAVMAATVYDEPEVFTRYKEICNTAFSVMFIIEAAMKIYAFGWVLYIKSGWNKFDFFLVVTSSVDMAFVLLASNLSQVVKILRVQKLLRLLRISRMFKLVKGLKGIKSLFATLVISLPAFWNVGALILLLFFVYAYTGVLFFGMVKRGLHLNDHANFEKFPKAMLTLFRIATNDEWKGVMEDCMVQPPHCDKDLGECGSALAVPFFISFVLLISIIMLNLFTAVIIENFEKQQDQDQWRLHPSMLEEFVELWGEYDDGSTTIDPKSLEQLLIRLQPPLGLGHFADNNDVLKFVYDLDIPLIDGRVPFHRTAYELVRRCSETLMPQGEIKNQLDRLIEKFFNDLPLDAPLNFSSAVMVPRIERKWRARFQTKKLRRRNDFRKTRTQPLPYDAACTRAVDLLSVQFKLTSWTVFFIAKNKSKVTYSCIPCAFFVFSFGSPEETLVLQELDQIKKQGNPCVWKLAPEGHEMLQRTSLVQKLTYKLHEWTSVMPFWAT
ncbi:hypothetical protein BSKO_07479 [Bryopsis sp. KO-2023]|nr:hypothetical protein BSKO_07479 [Bryopsis sp. KO-2023]